MIISATKNRRDQFSGGGFTIVELMISMSLASLLLAAVFTAFIMIGRSGMRVINYSVMETQTRRAFEQLAIDARMTNYFEAYYTGPVITGFKLRIPREDLSGSDEIIYGYDTSASSDGNRFYRTVVATGVRSNLIYGVKSLTILRYLPGTTPPYAPVLIPATTTASTGIKNLQISVSVLRGGGGVMDTTQVIRSTAFTLRNI